MTVALYLDWSGLFYSCAGFSALKKEIWPSGIGDKSQSLHSEFDTHSRSTEF